MATGRVRHYRGSMLPTTLLLAAALILVVPAAEAASAKTKRVSVSSAGVAGNQASYGPALSATGRYVAFVSLASNLVGHDTNLAYDIFVRDRGTGKTRRVSISSAGIQSDDDSYNPAISASGRFVAFESVGTNLVPHDTNADYDVFVRDRLTGKTRRVSVSSTGAQASDGASLDADISADGRFVVFESAATDLVPNDTNGVSDVFIRDRQTGKTHRISLDSSGHQADDGSYGPAISADGRYVAFQSAATNLVPGDLNARLDLFIRDRVTGKTRRVSVSSAEVEPNDGSSSPSISATGRFVAFRSAATNLVSNDTNGHDDIFVRDRKTGTTKLVSVSTGGVQADGTSFGSLGGLSADGRYVVFYSSATNLVAGDTNGYPDVFIRDRVARTTRRLSRSSAGAQANEGSVDPFISADGRFVAFDSNASNLIPSDANSQEDAFIRGPLH